MAAIPLFSLFFVVFSLFSHPSISQPRPGTRNRELVFRDDFATSGLTLAAPILSRKFGGPTVADLDSDGNYDIVLTFHNYNRCRIYLGDGTGQFRLFFDPRTGLPFRTRELDVHGVQVAQITARRMDRLVSFNVGGGSGFTPRAPEIYVFTPNRDFSDTSFERGFGREGGRLRSTQFMDLSMNSNFKRRMFGGGPDALFANFLVPPRGSRQFAYRNRNGGYALFTNLGDYSNIRRGRTELTNLEDNGNSTATPMEVISIQEMRFFRLIAAFTFREITREVLPRNLEIEEATATGVAEIDYDNDGDFDLFVTRADRALVSRLPPLGSTHPDILLRNNGGVYEDVSAEAGIPRFTNSMGITTGDFNNDGYNDLLVIQYKDPDYFLLNNGDGTFRKVSNIIPKSRGTVGDHAVSVDYDNDGALDVIVGHGPVDGERLGPYFLLKNLMEIGGNRNYLAVRVLNDPTRASTSLHAVVTIFKGRERLVRRVGSRGATTGGGSYMDIVHFGVGSLRTVNLVTVRWISNVVRSMQNVQTNQRITFGLV